MNLRCWLLPALADRAWLPGRTSIVIDVLRASTTVIAALEHGARCVRPCASPDLALIEAERGTGPALRGGERGGVKIEEFDLGNSPAEYDAETVRGRDIAFTTTNGTAALLACRTSRRVLIAALVNRDAVADIIQPDEDVAIVCAGTDGEVTLEDTLAAGAIIDRLSERSESLDMNDQGWLAAAAWRSLLAADRSGGRTVESQRLIDALMASRGGRNLVELGMGADILLAAHLDSSAAVPVYDPRTGEIRLPEG